MDDQYKRPEDLFGFRYGEDSQNEGKRDGEEHEVRAERSEAEEETVYRPSDSDRAADVTYTYGPYGNGGSGVGGAGGFGGGQDGAGQPPSVVPSGREYRPFTVSGSGRNWDQPPRRRAPLRAMFASFLVGVVAVGGLMFASDRYNWFTDQSLADAAAAPAASAATVSNTVSNAVDTVRPNNISQIFQEASPAVVKIETYATVQSRSNGSGGLFDDPFFRQFFGDDYGGGDGSNGGGNNGGSNGGGNSGGGNGNEQELGMGSGFIFDSSGYILTNEHVVDGATDIKVTVNGYDQPFTAKLLGSSYDLDLAVLKIEGSNFPTLKLGDSTASNMGDWVVAIGNPYGFDHTVTVGVLSANDRQISIQDGNGTRNYEHLLQTDASINPGNSGGPLLNLNGEVIGINTAVSTEAQGIGFAIPTSTISDVLDKLKTNTKIPSKPAPFIGATLQDLSPALAKQLGLDGTAGAMVHDVLYDSPAYNADLRQYDVITGIDGKSYSAKEDMISYIQGKSVGDKITLNIVRAGKKMDVTVTIGDKKAYDEQYPSDDSQLPQQ